MLFRSEFPGTPHAASHKSLHELEISPDPSSEDDEDDRRNRRHGDKTCDKTAGYYISASRSFMRTESDDSLKEVLDSTTNQHKHYKHVLLSPRGGGEDTDARPYAMGSLREHSPSSTSSGALCRVPSADVVLTRKDYRRKLRQGDKTAGDTDESM